jgi:dipeptidyl aminopeptidase/acylaminoacyl peptidase
VIDEPTPPPRRARVRIEVVTAAFFAVLIVGAVTAFPVLRDRMVETARSAVDTVLPAQWAAYYLALDEADPKARTDPEAADAQLMFASGSLPGKAARLLASPVFTGTWSPNGERFVASSGPRVFLADRDGQAKLLTELRDLRPTGPPIWDGDNEILFSATRTGQQHWLIRLDSRTGIVLDQRDIAIGVQPYSVSPGGKWLLAHDHRLGSGILLEVATGRRVQPAERESFAAWLGDGRVIVAVEREQGWDLIARKPESTEAETILELAGLPLLPALSSGGRTAVVVSANPDGTGARSIWVLSATGGPVRVAEALGSVYTARPSRDGRFVAFSEIQGRSPIRVRTGLIDVATKKVTYACDAGCAVLDVR